MLVALLYLVREEVDSITVDEQQSLQANTVLLWLSETVDDVTL